MAVITAAATAFFLASMKSLVGFSALPGTGLGFRVRPILPVISIMAHRMRMPRNTSPMPMAEICSALDRDSIIG